MAEISSYYYFTILLRAEVLPESVYGDAEEMTHNPFKENMFLQFVSWVKSPSYTVPVVGNPPRHTGFPGGASGKEPSCQSRRHRRHRFDPWAGKIPQRRAQQLPTVFLPRESHGQRSLAGYGP